MLKRTFTYIDFNGVERTEDFYFYLDKTGIIKLNSKFGGGIQTKFEEIVNKLDVKELVKTVDAFIDASYGVKSSDGRRFIQNEEVLADFKATPAYDMLFQELVASENAADKFSEFIKKILPADVQKQVEEEITKGNKKMPNLVAESNDNVIDVTPKDV